MEAHETHRGPGRILTKGGELLAAVRYEYEIDRRNRVWRGTAMREDGAEPLMPAAGPAAFETAEGQRAEINYYQRQTPRGLIIIFTGRGAPPGE